MIFTNLMLAASLAGGPEIQWSAPSIFIAGKPYVVEVQITAPEEGAQLANWLLTPAAFSIEGQALAKRDDERTFNLPGGFSVSGKIGLGPHIQASGEFGLGYAVEVLQQDPVPVRVLAAAPEDVDFMTLPVEQLAKYNVLISTNRGDMLCEVWPDVAPNHARNFLDLAYAGFYDGTIFHRVIPGFMIQGGDPSGTGGGDGPRTLAAEFNP